MHYIATSLFEQLTLTLGLIVSLGFPTFSWAICSEAELTENLRSVLTSLAHEKAHQPPSEWFRAQLDPSGVPENNAAIKDKWVAVYLKEPYLSHPNQPLIGRIKKVPTKNSPSSNYELVLQNGIERSLNPSSIQEMRAWIPHDSGSLQTFSQQYRHWTITNEESFLGSEGRPKLGREIAIYRKGRSTFDRGVTITGKLIETPFPYGQKHESFWVEHPDGTKEEIPLLDIGQIRLAQTVEPHSKVHRREEEVAPSSPPGPVFNLNSTFASFSDINTFIFQRDHVLPERALVEPVMESARDSQFSDFIVNGKAVSYSSLTKAVRQYDEPVFYGKPATSLNQAETISNGIFQDGRASPKDPHLDLNKYLRDPREVSGFLSTSKAASVAERFSDEEDETRSYGVIFIVDPRGAEVLDVEELNRIAGPIRPYMKEREIVFPSTLSPKRIYGALIIEREKSGKYGKRIIRKFLLNPNYQDPIHSTSESRKTN